MTPAKNRWMPVWVIALCAAVLAYGCNSDSEPERQLMLGGALDRPAAVSMTSLRAMPASTQTVSYTSGTGQQTHTYIGTGLWNLLDQAGIQLDASRRNDVLNRYVLATGGDAYKVVFP